MYNKCIEYCYTIYEDFGIHANFLKVLQDIKSFYLNPIIAILKNLPSIFPNLNLKSMNFNDQFINKILFFYFFRGTFKKNCYSYIVYMLKSSTKILGKLYCQYDDPITN